MSNSNKIKEGSIACTFVTMEDAEMAYNILVNRNYTPDEIHVLASQDVILACSSEENIQLAEVFKKGEILSDEIIISGSLKTDLNSEETKVLKHLEACGISDFHAKQFESSLAEKEIIIIVYPHNANDRREINEEFNFYKGKQINGSEAYTV
jgi:hypothetical protein